LCQPRVIVKMIVEKQMECRLAGETEVLGENLPQRHLCPSKNPTWPDQGLNPGRRGGKPATNRLSYGAAETILTEDLHGVFQSTKENGIVSASLRSLSKSLFANHIDPLVLYEYTLLVTIGFWRWCITFRNIEFSDSIHRPSIKKQTKGNTTFRKLDLFPSSGEGKNLFCWVP
jgi:hypothetical protein